VTNEAAFLVGKATYLARSRDCERVAAQLTQRIGAARNALPAFADTDQQHAFDRLRI
jgi:hypothetical protein